MNKFVLLLLIFSINYIYCNNIDYKQLYLNSLERIKKLEENINNINNNINDIVNSKLINIENVLKENFFYNNNDECNNKLSKLSDDMINLIFDKNICENKLNFINSSNIYYVLIIIIRNHY